MSKLKLRQVLLRTKPGLALSVGKLSLSALLPLLLALALWASLVVLWQSLPHSASVTPSGQDSALHGSTSVPTNEHSGGPARSVRPVKISP